MTCRTLNFLAQGSGARIRRKIVVSLPSQTSPERSKPDRQGQNMDLPCNLQALAAFAPEAKGHLMVLPSGQQGSSRKITQMTISCCLSYGFLIHARNDKNKARNTRANPEFSYVLSAFCGVHARNEKTHGFFLRATRAQQTYCNPSHAHGRRPRNWVQRQ